MAQSAEDRAKREPAMLYRRIEVELRPAWLYKIRSILRRRTMGGYRPKLSNGLFLSERIHRIFSSRRDRRSQHCKERCNLQEEKRHDI
jgi:hypothetical protein